MTIDPRERGNRASDIVGAKPISLQSGLAQAHARIQAIGEVCQTLVLEVDPAKRAQLLSKLAAVVNDHG